MKKKMLEKNENRVVTLVAVNNHYKELPLYLVPKLDKDNKLITGYNWANPASVNRDKKIFPLDKDTQVPVVNMERLDLSTDLGRCKYNFLLTHDEVIATGKEDAIQSKHLFYIHDVESESAEALKNDDLMLEAMNAVKDNISESNILDLAIFVLDGEDPRGYSSNVLKKRINDVCKKDPERVMKFFDKGQDMLLFIRKAHVYGIVSERPEGYFFGDIFLGHGYEEASHYMLQKGNEGIYDTMLRKLSDIVKPTPSTKKGAAK
jgi:hypothetical protein